VTERLSLKLFPAIQIFLFCVATVFGFRGLLFADNPTPAHEHKNTGKNLTIFTKGRLSLQFSGGKLSSPFLLDADKPDFDYTRVNLRAGWMIDDPSSREFFFRGNFEAILEFNYSNVTRGSGSYLAGAGAILRYNIVYPDTNFRPFIQAGGGIVLTDVYQERSQELIGNSYQFDLQLSLGVRFPLAGNWTIDIEGMYNHISNGGLSDRNDGVDGGGILVGLTYYFDKLWK
jgi:opacity protein-like surface antigen